MTMEYLLNRTPNRHEVNLVIFRELFESMRSCYGPYSGNTILDPLALSMDGSMKVDTPRVTRDGVSIFLKVKDNPDGLLSPFLSTLKTISARNDVKGGDGTTSTILFALSLYKKCVDNKFKPSIEAIKLISDTVDKYSYKADNYNTLIDAARVSLNNSDELVKPIAEAFTIMNDKKMDWKGIDIVPIVSDDIESDSCKLIVSNAVCTYNFPVVDKKKDVQDAMFMYTQHAIGSPIDVAQTMSMVSYFIEELVRAGKSKLVVCAPDISANMIEHIIPYIEDFKVKAGFTVELIGMFNPLNNTGEGSDDLAVATYMPTVDVYSPTMYEAGKMVRVSLEDPTAVFKYVRAMISTMPTGNLIVYDDHCKFIMSDSTSVMVERKNKRIAAIKEEIHGSKSEITRAKIEARLRGLIQESALLYIAAPTEEMKSMMYDQYKDACLQMRYAKKGVIAAGNIGIARILETVQKENKKLLSENTGLAATIEYVQETAINLTKLLLDIKADELALTGVTYQHNIEKDIVDCLARTPIETPEESIHGHDILKGKSSKSIVASAHTELNIVKSAIDICNMWMGANQVVWGSYNAARRYESYYDAITANK